MQMKLDDSDIKFKENGKLKLLIIGFIGSNQKGILTQYIV